MSVKTLAEHVVCKMSVEKTVLGIFRERRRPITFNSGSTPKEEYGNLLEAVKSGFDDVKTNIPTGLY